MAKNKQSVTIPPLFYFTADSLCPEIEIFRMSQLRGRVMPGQLSGSRRYYFYMLLLVTEGDVCQTVDSSSFRCRQGSIILIRPGQVHSFGDVNGWDGWLVLFRPELLPPGPEAVLNITGTAGFGHGGADADLFESALRQMYKDIHNGAGMIHNAVLLYHQLAALLIRLRMLTDKPDASRAVITSDRQRFEKFTALLEKKFSTWHLVSHYANALGCSSKTLTRATETCAGRSVKSYISERICLEARRLLTHTTASVSIISQTLGFDEPAHFIRFFKSTVGLSPERFRESV